MNPFVVDMTVLLCGLIAVMMLIGCSDVPIKICGTNQYWTAGDEAALYEQIKPYHDGQPIKNQNEDWERMRCENKACEVGYDYCKVHGGAQ